MSEGNSWSNASRRQVLEQSGKALTGGIILGSVATTASAEIEYDLDSDFNRVAYYTKSHMKSVDGYNYIESKITSWKPKDDIDLDSNKYRVINVEIEKAAGNPGVPHLEIVIDGEDGLELEDVGPGNTIGSNYYELGISTTKSVEISAVSGIQNSNLDIDDKTRGEKYKHEYDFSGDMRFNHETIEGSVLFKKPIRDWEKSIEMSYNIQTFSDESPDYSVNYTWPSD